jgi:WD40 repeat protein
MALSRDERMLITAVGDNTLRVWDLWSGREAAVLPALAARPVDVALSPDNRKAAAVDSAGGLYLFDLIKSGETIAVPGKPGALRRAVFTSDGSGLVSGDAQGVLTVLPLEKTAPERTVGVHEGAVILLALGPEGNTAVSFGADGRLVATDLKSGARRYEYKGADRDIRCLAIDRTTGVLCAGDSQGGIAVWGRMGREPRLTFQTGDAAVTGLAVHAAGSVLVSGDREGKVRIWSLKDGRAVRDLGKHAKAVNFVQLDAEGSHVLSASEDGTTRLWNVASGRLLLTLISTRSGWAVVDAQGRFDGNQQALNDIEWQDQETRLQVHNFTEVYYEPALLSRTLQDPDGFESVQSIPDGIHLPPKVDIEAGDVSGSRTRRVARVTVKGVDQGNGGVEDVRLYRNGRLVGGEAALATREEKSSDGSPGIVREYQVPLATGKNVLSAVAFNRERLESPATVLVLENQEGPRENRLWLVTVGINRYGNPKLNLNYAAVDAGAVKDFFTSQRPFPFSSSRLKHVADAQATKDGILDVIRLLQQVPAEDIAVLYIAGHGVTHGREWYFVPFELENPGDPDQLSRHGLSSSEFKREVEAIGANRVFLIIDACQSGGAVSPLQSFGGMKALRMMARTVGVHILAATDRNQYAVELDRIGHGIFTYSLLQGLEGAADGSQGDGAVSVREVMDYVENTVPALSRRFANYAQYPTGHSRGYDFGIALIQR